MAHSREVHTILPYRHCHRRFSTMLTAHWQPTQSALNHLQRHGPFPRVHHPLKRLLRGCWRAACCSARFESHDLYFIMHDESVLLSLSLYTGAYLFYDWESILFFHECVSIDRLENPNGNSQIIRLEIHAHSRFFLRNPISSTSRSQHLQDIHDSSLQLVYNSSNRLGTYQANCYPDIIHPYPTSQRLNVVLL